jgi:hypothetical protein
LFTPQAFITNGFKCIEISTRPLSSKGDVAAIKQVIDMGREQQAVETVEPLAVITELPRFDVARTQVSAVQHPGTRQSFSISSTFLPKNPLTHPGVDHLPFSRGLRLARCQPVLRGRVDQAVVGFNRNFLSDRLQLPAEGSARLPPWRR